MRFVGKDIGLRGPVRQMEMGIGKVGLVRIALWDGNYTVCIVVSVHVYDKTKNLALFIAIRVSCSK